jgi:ribulose-5-phosphate 4-epimerase/fuculose-1-phosphate aldolase
VTDGVIKYDFVREDASLPDPVTVRPLEAVRSRLLALWLIGVHEGIGYGNLSCRDGAGGFVVTATQTGHLETLGPRHYVRVTEADEARFFLRYRGAEKPSSESLTHATLYALKPGIGAVIHVHSRTLWDFMLAQGYPATADVPYGSPEMTHEVRRLYTENDPFERPVFAMRGHEEGVIAVGRDIAEAERALLAVVGKALVGSGMA